MDDSDIASAVINNLKRISPPEISDGEFTCLAAIVCCSESTAKVLCLCTGTKCCGDGRQEAIETLAMEGTVVKDSHAEILARRAFISYVISSLGAILRASNSKASEEEEAASELIFEWRGDKIGLKKGHSLNLYISDSPCGDASIYRRRVDGQEVEFTGAKRARVDKDNGDGDNDNNKREPHEQALSVLRTKSGRSDLPEKQRSTSMSCSDKICRWLHLGLQGSLLSPFVETLYLDRVVVGKDPLAIDGAQEAALERALLTRCGLARPPNLAIPGIICCFHKGKCNVQHKLLSCNEKERREGGGGGGGGGAGSPVKEDGSADPTSEERKRKLQSRGGSDRTKARPSGSSMNWVRDVPGPSGESNTNGKKGKGRSRAVAGGTLEVTQAQAGILQGASKDLAGTLKASSRLCRRKMAAQLATLLLQPEAQGVLIKPSLLGKMTNAPHDPRSEGKARSAEYQAAQLSYEWWKRADDDYRQRRKAFLSAPNFRDWLVANNNTEWGISDIL